MKKSANHTLDIVCLLDEVVVFVDFSLNMSF